MNPKHNNVIIEQDNTETQTRGSIIVADMNKEKPRTGIVIAVGPGTTDINGNLIPPQCSVGERVVFPSFSGIKIMIEGKEYITVKDTDVITSI